jgi:hypothetical protein
MMTAPFIAPRNNAELLALMQSWLDLDKFDPSQARDAHGRWTSGGGRGDSFESPANATKTRLNRAFAAASTAWGSAKPVLAAVADVATGIALSVAMAAVIHRTINVRAYAREAAYARARAQAEREAESAFQGGYESFHHPHRRTTETDAEKAVRIKHGMKAAKVMALYLRAGTPGEKAAAAEALRRMGIDISDFVKFAKAANIWSALDPFLTEAEAKSILQALLANLHHHDADALLRAALRSRVMAMQTMRATA